MKFITFPPLRKILATWAIAAAIGLLLGAALPATAQSGPYSAQIQRALASFLGIAHTWTGKQTFTAGSGTATTTPGGTLYWENTNTPNLADTNFVKTGTYVLPANTLKTPGDHLIVALEALFSAAGSSKTYVCNIGFTSWTAAGGFVSGSNFNSNATTTANADLHIVAEATYISSTVFNTWTNAMVGTSFQSTNFSTVSGTVSWTADNNIACEAKDGSSNAGAITLEEFRVRIIPR